MAKLLNNEEIIATSTLITLTNKRVQLNSSGYYISIFLKNISSIEKLYKSYYILIVLGVISFAGGFSTGGEDEMIIGGAVCLVFIAIYFSTRYNVISISPNGGKKLVFTTKGMSSKKVLDMIFQIETQIDNLNFSSNNSNDNTNQNKVIVKQNTENLFK